MALSFNRLLIIVGSIILSVFLLDALEVTAQPSSKHNYYKQRIDELSIYNDSVYLYIDSLMALGGEAYWLGRYRLASAQSVRNEGKEQVKLELDTCLEHFKAVKDSANWLACLSTAAYNEQDLKDYRAAIRLFNQGADLAIAMKDSSEITYFEGELGYLYMSVLEDMHLARYHIERSYDIAVKIEDWEWASRAACYLMEYNLIVKDTAQSATFAEKALQFSNMLDSTDIAHYDGNNTMSYFSLSTRQYDEAIKHGNILINKGRELEERDVEMTGILVIAEAYYRTNRLNEAYEYSRNAVAIAEETGDAIGLEACYDLHWQVCEAVGKTAESLASLKKYNEYLNAYKEESALVAMTKTLYAGDLERQKVEKEKMELTLQLATENSRFKSLLLVSVLGLLLALLVYSYIVYKRNRREREYNRTLEASNEVILRQKQNLEMNVDELKKDLEEKEREADSYYFAQSAIQIKFSKIILLEASNNYVLIHVEGRPNPLLERVKLKDLIEQFPTNLFVRIHRSYCVNVNHIISRPSKYVLKMSNEVVLNVSRSYVDELGDLFLHQGAV